MKAMGGATCAPQTEESSIGQRTVVGWRCPGNTQSICILCKCSV